jgi:RNA polymerase sigma-70 factor (ECF subfamily)
MESERAAAPNERVIFERHRRRLWGVAYRMLGSRADADDMVQEAWLRWHRAAPEDIRTPEAWLVTAITRLCIDRLRELRAEREAYVGPWLPEPLVVEAAPAADQAAELASDLSVALLAVLERLGPEERAAFLLHEVFDSDYGDIAKILGKSETACRQIVSRARKRVREAKPRVHVDRAAHARLLDALVHAIRSHDQAGLVKVLAPQAAWTSDGGGKARAARKVIQGADAVARFAVGVFRRHIEDVEFRHAMVNGEPGLAVLYQGSLFAVMSIGTDGVRILDVYSILNPEKLRGVELGAPH